VARRRVVEDHVSHERWLVSYADFITLLFAFFVVMYSISQVNEGKYKVLSNTLSEAFNIPEEELLNSPELTLDPIQIGEVAKSNPLNLVELRNNAQAIIVEQHVEQHVEQDVEQHVEQHVEQNDRPDKAEVETQGEFKAGKETQKLPDEFQQISDSLGKALGHLINQDLITIRGDEQWLEIELKSALLFDSGDATLSVPALEIMGSIVDVLVGRTNLIRVEGFTDSVPVNTPLFPSNWELSTVRAAAVVHLFAEEGIDPGRMAAIGYGQYQPVADNKTAEGRAANRRVVLRIAKEGELRPTLDIIDVTPTQNEPTENIAEPTQGGLPASVTTAKKPEDPMKGVKTIELEGGGLLFTNEPTQ
jgi:chemotaxis protein MotB